MAAQGHPYYPRDALIPGYAPNETPLPVVLGLFGSIVFSFTAGSVVLAKRYNPGLRRADQLIVAWFALCEFVLPDPYPFIYTVAADTLADRTYN
jgi:cholestenol delta-isomerase